jgi:hypothetical protein
MAAPNVRDFVHHVHVACLHPYDGSLPEQIELSPSFSGLDAEGIPILHVLHPRWCLACIAARATAIHEVYKRRLTASFYQQRHSDEARKERAYVRGVCSGKVDALSRSLKEGEQLEVQRELGEAVAELDLNGSAASDDLQSMIEPFQRQSIEYSELEHDMERWFAEKEVFDAGVVDGKIAQAQAERVALSQCDWERRLTMLGKAVL